MNRRTRKTLGTLIIAAPFIAITVYASVDAGAWWVGPAILLGSLALVALVGVGVLLLMMGE